MLKDWLETLHGSGFDAALETTGDPARDAGLAATATVIAPLAHLGLIRVEGEDAASFLHNLLTNDVNGLGDDALRRAGFCTPKGRLLADFLLWRDATGVTLQLGADVLPGMLKKLSMYLLRAKARLRDASAEFARIGLAGPEAAALLAARGLPSPAPMQRLPFEGGTVLGLDASRVEIVAAADRASALWQDLAASARPVGAAAWRGLDIAAGIPLITAATQEAFIPQMVNFELIGGVGFKKGCYPGQEIVARTQYLGKIKRRMYRAHVDNAHGLALGAGTPIYAAETGEQSCGNVVIDAPAAGGGVDLLAVVQSSCAGGPIHLGAPDGPVPRLLPLPYGVD